MRFPHFMVPWLGDGMVIGLNAVIHVLLSHGFAIGVFFLIALAEYIGYRSKNGEWEVFGKFSIKPTVVIITSVSAITGVGIWFTIGPLAPRASASMLRIFFWPWYAEWIVFFLEAVVLLLYYFLWDRMSEKPASKKLHIGIGFLYTVLALFSAVLITGIIGFMLTPDGWPSQMSRFNAYFNASLVPQTFMRFFGGIALGCPLIIMFLFLFRDGSPAFRRKALRLYGGLFLAFIVLAGAFGYWYFSVIPSTFKTHALFAVLTSNLSQLPAVFWIVNAVALGVVLLFGVIALLGSRLGALILLIPAMLFSFTFFAEFERIREFVRGPYLMPGYMWASETLLRETPYVDTHGNLGTSYWYAVSVDKPSLRKEGEFLFAQNCTTCHTIGGLNDIRDRLDGRPVEGITLIVSQAHRMVPYMPPFSGTDRELKILSNYLYDITNSRVDSPPARFPEISEEAER